MTTPWPAACLSDIAVIDRPEPAPRRPMFSIIIPWHGNINHLRRAAASVSLQTDWDFELMIVCNGAAAEFAPDDIEKLGLPPHRIVRSVPPDANMARNAGIDGASGRWLAFLDADDEFEPGKLAIMRTAIATDEDDILLSRGRRVRGGGRTYMFPGPLLQRNENLSEYFFTRGCNCSTTAIVARCETARSVRFTPGLAKFQDNDFLIRAQAAGASIRMLGDSLFLWHDSSEAGRISRGADYQRQMAWAKSLAPDFTVRAFHAFCARRVAQYCFPRDFSTNIRRFWNGWRYGGLQAAELILMIVRCFMPKSLSRLGVDLFAGITQHAARRGSRDAR